jgi:hypothetical protein
MSDDIIWHSGWTTDKILVTHAFTPTHTGIKQA